MTDQNPETPREPSGAINHDQEAAAPEADQGSSPSGHTDGADQGGTPANPGPVPAEPEDMSDTGSDIGSLGPDPASEEVAE